MAAVTQPFSFTGALQLAADQSLPADPIPFNFSGQYVAEQIGLLNLSGAGTQAVNFGSIIAPGVKGFALRFDPQQGAAPILCTINGGSQALEISSGGFLVLFNPAPATGITALSLAYTTSCQIRVWLLG